MDPGPVSDAARAGSVPGPGPGLRSRLVSANAQTAPRLDGVVPRIHVEATLALAALLTGQA